MFQNQEATEIPMTAIIPYNIYTDPYLSYAFQCSICTSTLTIPLSTFVIMYQYHIYQCLMPFYIPVPPTLEIPIWWPISRSLWLAFPGSSRRKWNWFQRQWHSGSALKGRGHVFPIAKGSKTKQPKLLFVFSEGACVWLRGGIQNHWREA